MRYEETTEALDELVQFGVVKVERGETQSDDVFNLTDFGEWLGDKLLFKAFNEHEELREGLKKLYEETK